MIYQDTRPVPVTLLTEAQAWPDLKRGEMCDVEYETPNYTGPVCDECKDGVPVSEDGLYIPYSGNLYKYLPRDSSRIDYIGPSCDYIVKDRGYSVPEAETLLNSILGLFIMIMVRRIK
jgi:hypothetical protein